MEKQYDNTKVMFIKPGKNGDLYGSCDWAEGVALFANNIRAENGYFVADIRIPTGETYVNKSGKECKAYKTVGALKYNESQACIVVDLAENKEMAVCKPREITSKTGEQMLIMNFRGDDTPREENPYMKDLEVMDTIPF